MNLEGQLFGQYKILEKIGAGGMATVYKAYQPNLDRDVAIKVMQAPAGLESTLRERFLREAQAVANLSHPNILPVFDVGQEGEMNYFVMKFVSGVTLKDFLGRPMALDMVSHFIDQIAGALDHAHSHGILHRDIKPSNILVEGDWALLADFGLAKLMVDNRHELTGAGMVMGTPTYLSPEQAEGKPLDRRTDIYSLGVVLYEMVTGYVPFEADTPMAIMFKHIYDPLPSPRRRNPNLPPEIEAIIYRALAKDPADRFERAGDLATALRAQLYGNAGAPYQTLVVRPTRLFISYKRNSPRDEKLATFLVDYLSGHNHEVFIDRSLHTGDNWMAEIDRQIKASDYLVVLLSQESAHSEMVQAEIRRAYEHRKRQGHPQILPVRVAYEDLLPYSIDAYLDPLQYVAWWQESDNERVGKDILAATEGRLPQQSQLVPRPATRGSITHSEDGLPTSDSSSLRPPLPAFDPRVLETLEAPGGVVKLRDRFYIQREADGFLRREISKRGTTSTIRAARQMGKSSLLVRGLQHAREGGARIVNLDMQRVNDDHLVSLDAFLRYLAEFMVRKLRLDPNEIGPAWDGRLGPQDKLTYFMEDYILPEAGGSIVLGLDEVDRLLHTDFHSSFFALLRSWHNNRAMDETWDLLNIVMVIATEPYLLIKDVNQSPFNVGLKLSLDDFDEEQVRSLNHRHGVPVKEIDFPGFLKLLNGHPYLTRKALYTLVTEKMTWPELTAVAGEDQGPFGDHLRRQHWLLRDEPELRAALKDIISKNNCNDQMALFRLLQAGLVKGSGDYYTCRCDLYHAYFKDKLK